MKVLIWGYGVIGSRHAQNFAKAGAQVEVLSRRQITDFPCHNSLSEALESQPDVVFITTETIDHYGNLVEVAAHGFSGHVIMEKPLFAENDEVPEHSFKSLHVSYNLRLHPLVQRLKQELNGQNIISSLAYVGQYLPDWRKSGKDYREYYSAVKNQGGGALRDLSHELDLSVLLVGAFKKVFAHGGHFSNLDIDSDDVFSIIGETEKCSQAVIHVNYLDRNPTRFFRIQTYEHSYVLDLINNTLQKNREEPIRGPSVAETYTKLVELVMAEDLDMLTSATEAQHVMRLIEVSEESHKQGKAISL